MYTYDPIGECLKIKCMGSMKTKEAMSYLRTELHKYTYADRVDSVRTQALKVSCPVT